LEGIAKKEYRDGIAKIILMKISSFCYHLILIKMSISSEQALEAKIFLTLYKEAVLALKSLVHYRGSQRYAIATMRSSKTSRIESYA
jgi:hypothetical protein